MSELEFAPEQEEIVDELPEVGVGTESQLRDFLDKYRTAMTEVVLYQLGWDLEPGADTRCGITSVFTERALYNKPQVKGLRSIHSHRSNRSIYESSDFEGSEWAKNAITDIARETGESTENIRLTLSRLDYAAQMKADGQSTEDIAEEMAEARDEIPNPNEEVIQKVMMFYDSVAKSKPYLLEVIRDYVDSGWGHTVVLLDIQFDGEENTRRYLVDLNAEQFGPDYDKLYLLPIEQAAMEGYTTETLSSEVSKVPAKALGGDTDMLEKTNVVKRAGSVSYSIKTSLISKAKVSELIAHEYRMQSKEGILVE